MIGSEVLVKQFRMINIARLLKFVTNLNLIITFKSKYICLCIFTDHFFLFFWRSGMRYFAPLLGFSVNAVTGVELLV